jgi:glyoxylase-like metal-dependent hydrolase (beta-lactamase superfamily II)
MECDSLEFSVASREEIPMNNPLLAVAASLLLAGSALAQGYDFAKVDVKPVKIAGAVWELEGAGGNIGVSAGTDGLLIVDDEFAPLADKIRAALKGIAPEGKLAFVVNTHWHGDHTGGNALFGKDATIIAQENVRERLAVKQELPGRTVEASPKAALPVITFEDGVSIWFNGEEIQVVHVPHGHTDGDAIIFFKGSNVVHMGDQFFNGRFPFVDLASGGDVAGYIKNVADMIPRIPAGARLIPGHGPVGTVEDLKTFHAMLVRTTDIVKEEIAKGLTLDEAKKAGLPAEFLRYSWDFVPTERWIEIVYTSFTRT